MSASSVDTPVWIPSPDGTFQVMDDASKRKYRVSVQEQLNAWVAGDSQHNVFANECCPDFSCCRPELKMPMAERVAYAAADAKKRETVLAEQLAKASEVNYVGNC